MFKNATRALAKTCDGKNDCEYIVDVNALGDPASGCAKNFVVEYQCAPDVEHLTESLPGEAGLKSRLMLSCAPGRAATADVSPIPVTPVPSNANKNIVSADAPPVHLVKFTCGPRPTAVTAERQTVTRRRMPR